jgi:RNA polymerase sigma-70 factor (ECF subfamily)
MSTPTTPFVQLVPAGPTDAFQETTQRAVAGDPAAIASLLRAVRGPVTAVVRRILGGSPAEADDVVQQTMIAFLQALPAYRGEGDPRAYARTIAVRTAIATRRRSRAEPVQLARGVTYDGGDEEQTREAIDLGSVTAEDPAVAQRRRSVLRSLLDEIPAEQAEALAMRIVLGWTLEEIATSACAPLNTIRSRIRLAKEALRRRIEASPELLDTLSVAEEASSG